MFTKFRFECASVELWWYMAYGKDRLTFSYGSHSPYVVGEWLTINQFSLAGNRARLGG